MGGWVYKQPSDHCFSCWEAHEKRAWVTGMSSINGAVYLMELTVNQSTTDAIHPACIVNGVQRRVPSKPGHAPIPQQQHDMVNIRSLSMGLVSYVCQSVWNRGVCVSVCVCVYTHIYIYMYIYAYIYVCVYTYICIYIFVHTHIYIYTHMHTYT